jgi:endonuclease/exonuclease/phosphatase family metal-dependent hydrolase
MSRCLALLLLLAASTALAAPPQLRVLTYNIHHGEGTDGKLDLERIANVITDAKPDLVALQEVDVETKRTGGVDQAKRLGELTKLHHAFGAAMGFGGGQYGNAVLSKWPIAESKVLALPYDKTAAGQEPRAALVCRVRPDGLPELHFVSTHLCHLGAETRLKQTREVNSRLSKDAAPLALIAGDFNARSESAPLRALLDKDWQNATAKISVIDYVLTRAGDPWRVVEAKNIDEPVASDHLPVLTILEWAK